MTCKEIAWNDIKKRSLEEVLREVLRKREILMIRLEGEDAVILRPADSLKPLPELEGMVPEGWKDGSYNSPV